LLEKDVFEDDGWTDVVGMGDTGEGDGGLTDEE